MVATIHFIPFQETLIETTVTNDVSLAKNWILLTVRSTYQEDPTVVIISLNSKSTNPQDDHSKVTTLQLCIKSKCLILQLLHMDHQNTNLEDLFRDGRFVFVGIDIAKTVMRLDGLIRDVKKVDVRDLVKVNYPLSYGLRSSSRLGLKAMASELLGFGSWKPKREICARDLGNEVLDEEVIKVLSVDAYVCYEIGFNLLRHKK